MTPNDPNEIKHLGTFKINEPGNWPTDIRLSSDVNVRILPKSPNKAPL